MGSRALLLPSSPMHQIKSFYCNKFISPSVLFKVSRKFSIKATNGSSLQPPDVPRLAETARISLNPCEVEEFAPKIRQVIDWFGQLQAVDLNLVEPAIRADTEDENLRDDVPETFEEREAIIKGIPCFEEPYVKVPKVLNKEG